MTSDQPQWEHQEEMYYCQRPVCMCFLTQWNASPEGELPYTKTLNKPELIARVKKCPYLS